MKQKNVLELKRKNLPPIAVLVFGGFSISFIIYLYLKGNMELQSLLIQFIPTALFIYFGIWLFQTPAFELNRERLKVNNTPIGKIEFQISEIENMEFLGKKIRFSYQDKIHEFGVHTGFISIHKKDVKTLHEKIMALKNN